MIDAPERLSVGFLAVRGGVQSMEEAIEQGGFTEAEIKELDKASVLIKVGAKMVKKVLVARGYRQLGRIAKGLK